MIKEENLKIGKQIYGLCEEIFPLCRSITGDGVRETMRIINDYIAKDDDGQPLKDAITGKTPELKINEIPTGTEVFDWTVPKEWRIRAAYIEDEKGNKVVDMADTNLHVMGYSTPIDEWVDLDQLLEHVFTLPDQPDTIPYVTSYYRERYGFCMTEEQKQSLQPGKYHMYIDSELFDGSLSLAECILPGDSDQEVLITAYTCHPSMANDDCSGPVVLAELIRYVAGLKHRRYTYHFVLNPETIGMITFLSQNLDYLKEHVVAGYTLTCVGDDLDYSMVESKYGDTLPDRVLKNVLKYKEKHTIYPFLRRGSDERQFNSVGVGIPHVTFCRSKFGEFSEYHTSKDDMNFVSPEGFAGAYEVMTEVIQTMEYNYHYIMTVTGEPQLGKRGLFPTISVKGQYDSLMCMMLFTAYADGSNDLIELSEWIKYPVSEIIPVIEKMMDNDLATTIEDCN